MLVTLKIKIEIWNIMLSGIIFFFFLKQSAVEDIRSVSSIALSSNLSLKQGKQFV